MESPTSPVSVPQSPIFNPAKIKFPKHIHNTFDDKFERLAGSIIEHCNENDATFDIPQCPIEEMQQKADMVRQLHHRSVDILFPMSCCMLIRHRIYKV